MLEGGAIYFKEGYIKNSGYVALSGNRAIADMGASGGAIRSTVALTFSGCSTIKICNNSAAASDIEYAQGGGIYTTKNLTFSDNASVTIRGNSIADSSNVQLQGLYSNASIYLRANESQKINVYDALVAGGTLFLNDETGNTGTITLLRRIHKNRFVHAEEELYRGRSLLFSLD